MSIPPNNVLLVDGPSVLQNRLDVAFDVSFNKNIDISGILQVGATGGSRQIYLNGISMNPIGPTGPTGPAGIGESTPISVHLYANSGNQTVNTSNKYYGQFFTSSTGSLTGFSFSTGVFTAPSNGTYFFTLTLFITSASSTTPSGRTLVELINNDMSTYCYVMYNQAYNSSTATATVNTCHYLTTGQTHVFLLESGSVTCSYLGGQTQLRITKIN